MSGNGRTGRQLVLSDDQENELREYFGGWLTQRVGVRSNFTAMVKAIQGDHGNQSWSSWGDNISGAILAAVAQERAIRQRMSMLSHESAEILRIIYTPIPGHLIRGETSASFDGDAANRNHRGGHTSSRSPFETSAAAAYLIKCAPGCGKWFTLDELVSRANGSAADGKGCSRAALDEVERLRSLAESAIARARQAYAEACAILSGRTRTERRSRLSRSSGWSATAKRRPS